MKVISKFIPIFEPGSSQEEPAGRTGAPDYRGGVFRGQKVERYTGPYGVTGLYGSSGSTNRLSG